MFPLWEQFIVRLIAIIEWQGHTDELVWAKSFDPCALIKELRADSWSLHAIRANIQGLHCRNMGDQKKQQNDVLCIATRMKHHDNREPNIKKLNKQPAWTETLRVGSWWNYPPLQHDTVKLLSVWNSLLPIYCIISYCSGWFSGTFLYLRVLVNCF